MGDPARPFGMELAQRVAARLELGFQLYFDHRDYCGMGLAAEGGRFFYLQVSDGWFAPFARIRPQELVDDERIFASAADFIAWLGAQSDGSLNGHDLPNRGYWDNQRITRERLEGFVAGAAPG